MAVPGSYSPRTATVGALYEQLERERLVHVRFIHVDPQTGTWDPDAALHRCEVRPVLGKRHS